MLCFKLLQKTVKYFTNRTLQITDLRMYAIFLVLGYQCAKVEYCIYGKSP